MQCMAWQQALLATEDLTAYRAMGCEHMAPFMLGHCQLTTWLQAALHRQQGMLHACGLPIPLVATSTTECLGKLLTRLFGKQL